MPDEEEEEEEEEEEFMLELWILPGSCWFDGGLSLVIKSIPPLRISSCSGLLTDRKDINACTSRTLVMTFPMAARENMRPGISIP